MQVVGGSVREAQFLLSSFYCPVPTAHSLLLPWVSGGRGMLLPLDREAADAPSGG